jgi:hypothetical protein
MRFEFLVEFIIRKLVSRNSTRILNAVLVDSVVKFVGFN